MKSIYLDKSLECIKKLKSRQVQLISLKPSWEEATLHGPLSFANCLWLHSKQWEMLCVLHCERDGVIKYVKLRACASECPSPHACIWYELRIHASRKKHAFPSSLVW